MTMTRLKKLILCAMTFAILLTSTACSAAEKTAAPDAGGSTEAESAAPEAGDGAEKDTAAPDAGGSAEAESAAPDAGDSAEAESAAQDAGDSAEKDTAAPGAGGTAEAESAAPGAGSTAEAETAAANAQDTAREEALTEAARELTASMSMEEKISQMIIPAICTWDGWNVTDLSEVPALAKALREHPFGGIILFDMNIVSNAQTAKLVSDLQENNAKIKDVSVHIPYFMPLDAEGGIVNRLSSGTRMTGHMAIGATGADAVENARITGQVIGEELRALGFNVDFAPDIDVNNNPANPVIGTRSFSDDPQFVAELGNAFREGLAENHIIATFKHFPGHGDTGVDSHIGTPSVGKTYQELKKVELVPFAAAVESGAEMIMTAHITFPRIDDKVTFGDGVTKGYYPATMSKKMITQILRKDLGYDGVVVTDALEMDAIGSAGLVPGLVYNVWYSANIAEKVINAGVDLLLIPANLSSEEAAEFYDVYIDTLVDKVEEGVIPEARIDESVERILRLKLKEGILEGVETAADKDSNAAGQKKTGETGQSAGTADRAVVADKAGRDSTAQGQNPAPGLDAVGSEAHHAREMEIARQAVTVVKNHKGTLPASGDGTRIVILGRSGEDDIAIRGFVKNLRDRSLLKKDTDVTVDYYCDTSSDVPAVHYPDELREAVRKADYVIGTTSVRSIDALYAGALQYTAVRRIIEDTHDGGGRFILLSENLPYDAARFQEADAIVLAYMGTGLDVDPTSLGTGDAERPAGNANVAAALETIFGGNVPRGKLPVDIPVIKEQEDGTLSYEDELLYERGTGLTYEPDN